MHTLLRAFAVFAALAGCVDDPIGPTPVWFTDGQGFFDTPWPSDARRHDDGTLDLDAFPNPFGVALVDNYLAGARSLEGFGNNASIYVQFDGPLDSALLPTPEESLDPGSSLRLVDIDPHSPHWGEAFPVLWHFTEAPTSYTAPNLLAVSPMFGFPLRPATQYALIVTTGVARPHDGFARALENRRLYRDLRNALPHHDLDLDDVAIATVFTTGDPVGEMATMARFVRDNIAPPDLNLELELLEQRDAYLAWRTHYPSPVFTHGERPYLTEGGEFRFRDDGQPLVASWDDLRLAVCTPPDLEHPPDTGWPVVIYQHGTGGTYRGFCDGDGALEVATRLGEIGVIGLGIDQPLHDTRNGGEPQSDLANFNLFNPVSATTNFRQGALDAIYLARTLARQPWVMRTPGGLDIPLDPDRVMFMGHSQGGLTGGLAAPWFHGDVKAAVLSGSGGVLAITVVERKDILDFAELVRSWLKMEADDPITEFHPFVSFIQTVVEITDPVNYAPYWFDQRGTWAEQAPTPVLLTSGTNDEATPYRTAIALAAGARLPVLEPRATAMDALDLRGVAARRTGLLRDAPAWDGTDLTAGFSQWVDGSHHVVFRRQEASDVYVNFLQSAADGHPAIWFDAPEE